MLRTVFPILFSVCILLVSSSQAQTIKSFTPEASKYVQELENFLGETNKKETQEIIAVFKPLWMGGKFSTGMQEAVYKTSNAMLAKRMKAFPDFESYVKAMGAYVQSGQGEANFKAWHTALDQLVTGKSRTYSQFLSMSEDLFTSNILYKSSSTEWATSDRNYTFTYDSIPKITFGSMNLVCRARGDSMFVFNTSGVYMPTLETFLGLGGRVYWEKAGLSKTAAYADLSTYSLDVSKNDYTADTVSLSLADRSLFTRALTGKLQDKIVANNTPERSNYPKFESYDLSMEIKNIVKDIDYTGGFSLQGAKILGSGTPEHNAKLFIKWKAKPFMEIASQSFIIRADRISSANASVLMRYGIDSIYHPSLEMKYTVKDRELSLLTSDNLSSSPYFDSFHNLDLYFESMVWKIDDPKMDMKMITGAGENKMVLESENLFKDQRFMRVQGLSSVSPLYVIKQFAEKYSMREVYIADLAKYMKLPEHEVRSLMIMLSNNGFVSYDADDQKVIVKDRLYHYLEAKAGKKDYDVIELESIISGMPNATINLLNFDLDARGVSQLMLSDSQNVVIYPSEQEMNIHENLDFSFGGRVKAGRFDFFGKEFDFNYESFKFDLNNVDSLRMKIPEDQPGPDGRVRLVPVQSVLQNLSGDLKIDHPGNRSGRRSSAEYPIFKSAKESYVYYDRSDIYGGVYKRDRFYFTLLPFTIDSLNRITKEGMVFDGSLVSADIFPEFKEKLTLQPDYSLGFVREAPAAGFPAYKGKGKYFNTILLSNEGFKGRGYIEYLSSTLKSKKFTFFPDSTKALAEEFNVKKGPYQGVEFPAVKGREVAALWLPYFDAMNVVQKKDPIDFFEGQALLAGNLTMAPKGITAQGLMTFGQADLQANVFNFKQNSFGSDTADFRLKTDDSGTLGFATKNVKSNVDFTKRLGEFKSNGGGSYVTFPANQYICYIDEVKWYMDREVIELLSQASKGKTGETGSEFVSIHPLQDSLRFFAPLAIYSLKDYLIKAEQVDHIDVADAIIKPDKGNVVVERNAKMQTLRNAEIVADRTNKFHKLFNATIDIQGKRKYSGSADYNFFDQAGLPHLIKFTSVSVDDSTRTVAIGEVYERDDFSLSPKLNYKGGVKMKAWRQNLTFNGFAKLNLVCEKLEASWFGFDAELDPKSFNIPINSATRNESNEQLFAGLMMSADTMGVYPVFIGKKFNPKDQELMKVEGLLNHNRDRSEFVIAPEEKLKNPELPGNMLVLDEGQCLIKAQGELALETDLGQVKLKSYGSLTYNLNNDSTTSNVMMVLDFFFSSDAFKLMSESISITPRLEAANDNTPAFKTSLSQYMGEKKATEYLNDVSLYGAMKKLPDELKVAMIISDVKLNWNPKRNAFVSEGLISISMIDKVQVSRKMNGLLEVARKRSGDVVTLYLQPTEQTWYYFSYTKGVMQVFSSDPVFNDAIRDLKPEKRVNDSKDGKPYQFMLSTERRKTDFLRKINEATVVDEE